MAIWLAGVGDGVILMDHKYILWVHDRNQNSDRVQTPIHPDTPPIHPMDQLLLQFLQFLQFLSLQQILNIHSILLPATCDGGAVDMNGVG